MSGARQNRFPRGAPERGCWLIQGSPAFSSTRTVGRGGGWSVEDSALPGPHLSSHPSSILTANTNALVSRIRDMGEGWEPYTQVPWLGLHGHHPEGL